jgi:hypothetical protein
VVVASFQSGGVQIECRFAPTAMQGVVPAAVLQQLPAAMGTLSLSSTTQSRLPAGTSTVDVTLRSLAIGADGHVVGGNVTFQ